MQKIVKRKWNHEEGGSKSTPTCFYDIIVILTCHDHYASVHRNNLDYRDVNCG